MVFLMNINARIWVFSVLGMALLIADFWVLFCLSKPVSHSVWSWLAALVSPLGLFIFYLGEVSWPQSPTTRIIGFPFFMCVLELHNDHWRDYVGGFTPASAIGNLAVGLLTPPALVKLAAIYLHRHGSASKWRR